MTNELQNKKRSKDVGGSPRPQLNQHANAKTCKTSHIKQTSIFFGKPRRRRRVHLHKKVSTENYGLSDALFITKTHIVSQHH